MNSRIAWSGWVCATTFLIGCGGVDSMDGDHTGSGGSTGGASPSGGASSGGPPSGGASSGGASSGGASSGGAGGAITGGSAGYAGGEGGASGGSSGSGGSGGAALCAPNAACNGLDYCEDLCFGEECCYLSCDCRVDESTSCAADVGHLCCTMVCK